MRFLRTRKDGGVCSYKNSTPRNSFHRLGFPRSEITRGIDGALYLLEKGNGVHRAEPPLILIPRAFSRGVAHKISIMQSAPRVSPVVRSTLGATSSRPGQKLIRSSEIRASLPANSPPSLPPSLSKA